MVCGLPPSTKTRRRASASWSAGSSSGGCEMLFVGRRLTVSRHAKWVMAVVGTAILGVALVLGTVLRPAPGPVETAPQTSVASDGYLGPPVEGGTIEQTEPANRF